MEKEKEKSRLEMVNEEITTVPITRTDKNGVVRTKNYAEVAQRIKAFRKLYPEGSIETEIVSLKDGVCLMKAIVKNENGTVLGTGYAFEKEDSSFINKTSFIENCETSAVGRALGMLGIGIDAGFASYEEVANAQLNQEQSAQPAQPATKTSTTSTKKISEKQIALISQLYTQDEINTMISRIGVESLSEISLAQASKMISARKNAA
jgi:hypothetical protein